MWRSYGYSTEEGVRGKGGIVAKDSCEGTVRRKEGYSVWPMGITVVGMGRRGSKDAEEDIWRLFGRYGRRGRRGRRRRCWCWILDVGIRVGVDVGCVAGIALYLRAADCSPASRSGSRMFCMVNVISWLSGSSQSHRQ